MDGHGAIKLGDGELRCGAGCYCLAPPSRHPDGQVYRWHVPIGGEVPLIDPREAGLATCWARGQEEPSTPAPTHRVDRSGKDSVYSVHSVHIGVGTAISNTLPTRVGQRRDQLFWFARELKAIPELADGDADAKPFRRRGELPFHQGIRLHPDNGKSRPGNYGYLTDLGRKGGGRQAVR